MLICLFLCMEARGSFSWVVTVRTCVSSWRQNHKSMGVLQSLGLLEVLTLRIVNTEPSSNSSIEVQVFLPAAGSCGGFCLWVSAPLSCESISLCLSNLGGKSLPCDLTVVDFSVGSVLNSLGWMAPSMPDWKARDPLFPLNIILALINILWLYT